MSKIERFQGNVRAFASDAQGMERTVFGGTNQADDLTSQITASFLRGWGIVGASEHPSLEDFNAAMYAMSQFIAYQHQMGVAEWHAQQEYHIGSICTHNGESYQSLQDANIGNEPPSSNWTPVLTSKNGLSNLGLAEAGNTSGKLALIGNAKTDTNKCAVIVKTGSNANGKYRIWSDGSIDMWGNGIANSSGDALINYPISLPAAAQNITTTPLVLSTGTSRPTTSVMVVTDLTTATKATFFVKRADGTTSADGFYWSANYASF